MCMTLDGLLGDNYPYIDPKTKQVGITVTMLPRDQKGLEIGNRQLHSLHYYYTVAYLIALYIFI